MFAPGRRRDEVVDGKLARLCVEGRISTGGSRSEGVGDVSPILLIMLYFQ